MHLRLSRKENGWGKQAERRCGEVSGGRACQVRCTRKGVGNGRRGRREGNEERQTDGRRISGLELRHRKKVRVRGRYEGGVQSGG